MSKLIQLLIISVVVLLFPRCEYNSCAYEYSVAHTYVWEFSISEVDQNDTLSRRDQINMNYIIEETKKMCGDEGNSTLKHYLDDQLVRFDIIERTELQDWTDPKKIVFYSNQFRTELYFVPPYYTSERYYMYNYPFDKINGVKVKNYFKEM